MSGMTSDDWDDQGLLGINKVDRDDKEWLRMTGMSRDDLG